MKFVTISAVMALGFCAAGAASAETAADNNYVQLNLGSGVAGRVKGDASIPGATASWKEDLKAGFFGSALVGHGFGNGVSLEGEAYLADNDIKTGDLNALLGVNLNAKTKSYGALANIKFESPTAFDLGSLKVAPYAAGGVGYGHTKGELAGLSDSGSGVNWQLKAGLAIQASANLTWDLGYRYLTTAKFKFDDGAGNTIDGRAHINAVTAGARFSF